MCIGVERKGTEKRDGKILSSLVRILTRIQIQIQEMFFFFFSLRLNGGGGGGNKNHHRNNLYNVMYPNTRIPQSAVSPLPALFHKIEVNL